MPASRAARPQCTTRRGDACGQSLGMPTAARRRVTESGSRRTPVSKALSPSATERNSGTAKKRPAWIMNWKKNIVIPPAQLGVAQHRGPDQRLPAAPRCTRCSHQKKTQQDHGAGDDEHEGEREPPQRRRGLLRPAPTPTRTTAARRTPPGPRPAAERMTPETSMRGPAPSVSTSLIRRVSRTITATMTTSPANTRRQVHSVVTAPPIRGPAATAMARRRPPGRRPGVAPVPRSWRRRARRSPA